jgi:hypothetical protein
MTRAGDSLSRFFALAPRFIAVCRAFTAVPPVIRPGMSRRNRQQASALF